LVRSASAYNTILTNWTAVSEQGANTGYYPVTSVVSVPDAGAIVEFRQTSNTGTFLSAVTVDPVPANFTDMAITASTGQVTVGTLANNVITANSINSGAITNAKFAAGAIDATAVADNAITAAKIATDAFDADAIAASAVTEIQAGLATQASVDAKASQASVDALNAKADDITALVL
jgi:hypothetical protein